MMRSQGFRLIAVFGGIVVSVASQAALIDPFFLDNTTAPEPTVVNELANNGYIASVGNYTGGAYPGGSTSISDFGNQTASDVFAIFAGGASQTWSILWQHADNAALHAIGYYTNVGAAAGSLTAADITWVVRASSFSPVGAGVPIASGSLSGAITNGTTFGLAFYRGTQSSFNMSDVTFSESYHNPFGFDNMASIKYVQAPPGPVAKKKGLLIAVEDEFDYNRRDYNDFAIDIQGAQPVPEPATMAALGIGIAALIRRRNKK